MIVTASVIDWKKFYTGTFNIIFYGGNESFNRAAKYMLAGKEPPDEIFENLYPLETVKILDENQNLSDLIESHRTAKPIGTVIEIQAANNTLEKSLKSLKDMNKANTVQSDMDHQALIKKNFRDRRI